MNRNTHSGTARSTPKRSPRRRALLAGSLAAWLGSAATPAQDQVHPPGVTKEAHQAIQRGLVWLSRNQSNDGAWRAEAGGYGSYPAAMTGLAGMAILAGGSTPTRGKQYSEIRRSVDFLMKNADPSNGVISVAAEEGRGMYGHGFATLYLASVFGMEEDQRKQERLKRILDKAVTLIGSAQSAAGGWIYTPDSSSDEGSVTVTQVQALRACRMSGLVVDKKVIDRAVTYIRRCQNGDGGIRYSLVSGNESRPPITAAGVAVLYNAGVYDDQPFVEKAYEYCKKHISPSTDNTGFHFYTQLYWAQALYQRGGKDWSDYQAKITSYLLGLQNRDGSWDGDRGVGPVYGTSIALIILQLPYALVPIFQR